MNIFNRIIVVLLLLFLIVFSIVSAVNVFAHLFAWSNVAIRAISFATSANIYIKALVTVILLVVSIILLIFEFYRRKAKTANISDIKSGGAMVDLKSASGQIKEELSGVEDISDLKVNVVPKSDGVIINIYAKLRKGLNISEKMQQVIDKASKFASENLGFKIIKTNFTAVGFTTEKVEKISKMSEEVKDNKDTEKSSNS